VTKQRLCITLVKPCAFISAPLAMTLPGASCENPAKFEARSDSPEQETHSQALSTGSILADFDKRVQSRQQK
jgi:hypothetical protein